MSDYAISGTTQIYYDAEGDPTTLYKLIRLEPDWAHSRIKVGEEAIRKVAELETGIQKFLDGDYPHPRRGRPHDCSHGIGYWQECGQCNDAYLSSLLPTKPEAKDE